jgi:hypothetical protein
VRHAGTAFKIRRAFKFYKTLDVEVTPAASLKALVDGEGTTYFFDGELTMAGSPCVATLVQPPSATRSSARSVLVRAIPSQCIGPG